MVVYTITHQAQNVSLFSLPTELQKYSSTGKGLTNSVFGLQIWLMRHEFNQNGSVRCFLQNELTSCGITITGVLQGDRRHEPMTQTKQLKEFRFLDQIVLDGDIPLTKHAVSHREYC